MVATAPRECVLQVVFDSREVSCSAANEAMPPRWQKKGDWKEASPKRGGKGRNAAGGKGRGHADGTGGSGAGGLDGDVLKHAAAVKRALTSKAAEARRKD